MNIIAVDSTREPETFTPDEYFCAFKDTKKNKIIGYGNIMWNLEKGGIIYVENIESLGSVGDSCGRSMVEYMLKESPTKTIEGKYLKDSYGFWKKMGAKFSEDYSFKITLKDYNKAKASNKSK